MRPITALVGATICTLLLGCGIQPGSHRKGADDARGQGKSARPTALSTPDDLNSRQEEAWSRYKRQRKQHGRPDGCLQLCGYVTDEGWRTWSHAEPDSFLWLPTTGVDLEPSRNPAIDEATPNYGKVSDELKRKEDQLRLTGFSLDSKQPVVAKTDEIKERVETLRREIPKLRQELGRLDRLRARIKPQQLPALHTAEQEGKKLIGDPRVKAIAVVDFYSGEMPRVVEWIADNGDQVMILKTAPDEDLEKELRAYLVKVVIDVSK